MITSLDAQTVACKDHWVITSPNMNFVLEPHIFEEDELCPCADGQFGLQDCFQWPQTYEKEYPYAVCIPQKNSILSLEIAWYTVTPNDFIIPPGSKFAVGMLEGLKVKSFNETL